MRKIVLLFLIALSWTALALRTPPIITDFSRGLAIAETNQPYPPALLPLEEGTLVAWLDRSPSGLELITVMIGPAGQPAGKPSPLATGLSCAGPAAFVRSGSESWLLLLARETTGGKRHVYALSLDGKGTPRGAPIMVSPPAVDIRSYRSTAAGNRIWVSALGADGSIWASGLDTATGEVANWQLGRGISTPDLAADAGGTLHVVWAQETKSIPYSLLYSTGGWAGFSPPAVINESPLATGTIPVPPAVSVAGGWVYVAAGFEHRGKGADVKAEVKIIAFPNATPHRDAGERLVIPSGYPEEFPLEWEGLHFFPIRQDRGWPTPLYRPRGFPGRDGVALFTVQAELSRKAKRAVQPIVVALKDGAAWGWLPVAMSRDMSYSADLARSRRGWHVVWQDMLAYGDYRLFYASTAPEERAALNRVGWDDLGYFLGTSVLGIVGGLSLLPLFLMAAVPGLVILFVHYARGGEERLKYTWPKVLLAASILPYLVLKIALAGAMGSVPFAQWLSQSAATTAGRVLPFVPSLISLGIMGLYCWRREMPSLLPAWLVFVISDLALSLLILGPAFAGG